MERQYKDSGIEWIGRIPKEWKACRFKYAGSFEKGKLPEEQNIEQKGFPIIGASEMLGKEPRVFTMDNLVPVCGKEDILILWDGANAGIVANGCEGVVSSTAVKFDCNNNQYNKQFVFYLLKYYENYFRSKVGGTTIPHMNQQYIDDCICLLPSLSEQQHIAEYLDGKCEEIDGLIALQEHMIAQLTEYKLSVITETVTKGLDPDSQLVPSYIDWIGDIPKGWGLTKMDYICSVITDFVASGSFESLRINVPYIDSPDYAMLVRTADLSGSAKTDKRVYISKHSYDFLKNSNLFGGEIILPNIGASVGDVYMVPESMYSKMSLGPNAIMVKTKYFDKYFYYYFLGEPGRRSVINMCQATAQPKFNKTQLRGLQVLLPSIEEQKRISIFLDAKCDEIDKLIETKQQKIETLKEYKKSVIYEAVTGKTIIE